MRAFMHTAWATVLLFGIEGNTRALTSGTAIVQSRFCLYKEWNELSKGRLSFNERSVPKILLELAKK